AKRPEERYGSCAELRDALRRLDGAAAPARSAAPASSRQRTRPDDRATIIAAVPGRKRAAPRVVAGVAGVLLLAALVARPRAPPAEAPGAAVVPSARTPAASAPAAAPPPQWTATLRQLDAAISTAPDAAETKAEQLLIHLADPMPLTDRVRVS